jgi:hypothetical protein
VPNEIEPLVARINTGSEPQAAGRGITEGVLEGVGIVFGVREGVAELAARKDEDDESERTLLTDEYKEAANRLLSNILLIVFWVNYFFRVLERCEFYSSFSHQTIR